MRSAAGVLGGTILPGLFGALAAAEIARVNLPVAVLIWAMVCPMTVGVEFVALARIGERPWGLVIALAVNWLVKPFTMGALGVLFFQHVFAGLIPPDDAAACLAGVILLGAAPCTATVFVWSTLIRGDATHTLVRVSPNDVMMILAFSTAIPNARGCGRPGRPGGAAIGLAPQPWHFRGRPLALRGLWPQEGQAWPP